MANRQNTTRNSRNSTKATPLPVLPSRPQGVDNQERSARKRGAVLLDVALLRLWAILRQQLDVEYSHWRKMKALKAPLKRKLATFARKLGDERAWAKREEIHAAFERTPAGKKAAREYEAYNAACKISHKAARSMLLKKPKTVAGAAVFSIAAFYESDWAGFGFRADGTAASRIVLALSRAGGLRLPISVRQMVS